MRILRPSYPEKYDMRVQPRVADGQTELSTLGTHYHLLQVYKPLHQLVTLHDGSQCIRNCGPYWIQSAHPWAQSLRAQLPALPSQH